MFPTTSLKIMAFKPKTFEKKLFYIVPSVLHHGYCRYSTVKLRKANSISWLHPCRILAEFLLSLVEFC